MKLAVVSFWEWNILLGQTSNESYYCSIDLSQSLAGCISLEQLGQYFLSYSNVEFLLKTSLDNFSIFCYNRQILNVDLIIGRWILEIFGMATFTTIHETSLKWKEKTKRNTNQTHTISQKYPRITP